MEHWHDVVLMCSTAGALYGAIRYDLKFLRFSLNDLKKDFEKHMEKYHKDRS